MTPDDLRAALDAACRHVDLNDARYRDDYLGGLKGWRGWGRDWACYCARLHPDRWQYADGRAVLARWAGVVMGHLLAPQGVSIMRPLPFLFDDGGRAAAGYKGTTSDCVARAVAIAGRMPYQAAYDLVNGAAKRERPRDGRKRSAARTGVAKATTRRVMESLGWTWTPTMSVGSGTTVHLREGELPTGRLVVSVSGHLVAVIDGVAHDTSDPSRNGTRCVYGFWTAPTQEG